MKKIIILGLLFLLFIFSNGVNKNNAIVVTEELDVSQNLRVWTDLDLSAYTSNKLGKCLLYCDIIDGDEIIPSEVVWLKFRPKGENVKPQEVYVLYGEETGVVECWTDDDGIIQWYSEYDFPVYKTVTIQIKIMININ